MGDRNFSPRYCATAFEREPTGGRSSGKFPTVEREDRSEQRSFVWKVLRSAPQGLNSYC